MRLMIWTGVLLAVLGGTIFSLTILRSDDGDPVICRNCWFGGGHHHHASEGRRPSSILKTLASAQADFRANDRGNDGKNRFWRADVAGLYALAPGGGPAIQRIEGSLAMADDRPLYDLTPHAARRPMRG